MVCRVIQNRQGGWAISLVLLTTGWGLSQVLAENNKNPHRYPTSDEGSCFFRHCHIERYHTPQKPIGYRRWFSPPTYTPPLLLCKRCWSLVRRAGFEPAKPYGDGFTVHCNRPLCHRRGVVNTINSIKYSIFLMQWGDVVYCGYVTR